MSNFMEEIKKESEKYGASTGGSSDFFKFKEGVNKMRILVQPQVLATHFFGKGVPAVVCIGVDEGCEYHKEDSDRPGIKLVTYVIDREDEGKMKLAELPLSISYSMNDLQQDEDYEFETFPMPYDVKITHDPDNPDPKAKYRLQPSPKRTEVTKEEQDFLEEKMSKMTPEEYVEKRKEKQKSKQSETKIDYPEGTVDPADIPF